MERLLAKKVLSLGLIGAGGFGLFHRNAMELLRAQGRARLVAVADPSFARGPGACRELAPLEARVYADYRELLASEPDLDAITIAAPIPYHEEIAYACLERGIKIYLEKPPVPLIQQLDGLIAADRAQRVHVGFQLIQSGWAEQIKQWVVQGRFGSLRSIRAGACWPRTDAYYARSAWAGKMTYQGRPVYDGPCTNALSHLMHCITYLASAQEQGYESPVAVQGELYRARAMEAHDTACLRGLLGAGVEFGLALTHATNELLPFQLRVIGTKGWAQVSNDGRRLESSWGSFDFPEETDALVNASYRRFANFVEGCESMPVTRLADTRGYVLATNGLLMSSGGVHEIEARWICRHGAEGDSGRDVSGLRSAVEQSIQTGALYSEMEACPWAVTTPSISLEGLRLCPQALLERSEQQSESISMLA